MSHVLHLHEVPSHGEQTARKLPLQYPVWRFRPVEDLRACSEVGLELEQLLWPSTASNSQ